MRKRIAAETILSPRKSYQFMFFSGSTSTCILIALAIQFFFLIFALAVYTGGGQFELGETLLFHSKRCNKNAHRHDEAQRQMRFLDLANSSLQRVYQDGHLMPPLNGTSEKMKAVPLSVFCKGDSAKVRPKYAVFKDVLFAERKIYLPSTINCSALPRPKGIFLRTKFNQGQRSTPEIELMVVPSAKTTGDFEPHLSCHERVYEPSVLFSFINWPQYGHAVFNGVSLLWEIFSALFEEAGPNIRLYAYGDSIENHNRQQAQENSPFFDMKMLDPLMRMFSGEPVRSLANLLKQSDRHPVCFSYLVVGLSGADLDHYNFHAPLKKWREFSSAVKSHFDVKEPPRVKDTILERVAPQDALGRGSINPDEELGNMTAISWKSLPGRPRLTIIDRKSSRVIINVRQLERIAVESGYFNSVELVYPEEMSVEEQVQVMGVTDVLFGIDGTGLMNGIFLPEGGVIVHVRPFGCKEFLGGKGVNFDRLFAANPGRVVRYESGERNSSRFASDITEVSELAFNHNSSVTWQYRFSFILKQDTLVDPVAFRCILDTSDKLLHGVSVDWDSYRSCTRTVFF